MAILFNSQRNKPENHDTLHLDPSLTSTKHPAPAPRWCPRLTRVKLVGMLIVTLLAVLILLLQCLSPSLLSSGLCCTGNSQQQQLQQQQTTLQQTFQQLPQYDDEDYAYDETGEGLLKMRYRHTKRSLPQALIIGVRKGGTRALLEFLNLHPSIQAEKKEMHFFDTGETYAKGLDWYRKKMPYRFKDQITIEKTPAYFTTEEVPERVYNMNKSIHLIIVVRDPIERAISDYTQIHTSKMEKGRYHKPFEELVLDENGDIRRSYAAIRRSLYHRHMVRWLQFFPLRQFHFVSSENLVNNPVQELSMVEKFLGLEPKLNEELFYFNQTKGFYCIKKSIGLNRKKKCLAKSKGRTHPLIQPSVIEKLQHFFAPHNNKFFDLIDNHRFKWSGTSERSYGDEEDDEGEEIIF